MFDSLSDTTPTVVADLRLRVHNFWDRGLLGLAVPPGFDPAAAETWRRYVYVLCTRDSVARRRAAPSGAPTSARPRPPTPARRRRRVRGDDRWLRRHGTALAAARRRLRLDGERGDAPRGLVPAVSQPRDRRSRLRRRPEVVRQRRRRRELHQLGLGTVRRNGPDPRPARGVYYTPANPCADPPFPIGTPQTKPTAEGGALRSQSPRRTAGELRLLNGAILRVDPATGNPLARQSPLLEPGRRRTADHRVRPAQSVPDDREARHQRSLDRRRRLEHLGRGQSHPRPHERASTSAGPATRAARASTRASTSAPRRSPRPPSPSTPTTTAPRS